MRHGETSFNAEGRVQGHIDTSTLTDKGVTDAQAVAEALQGLPIDAVYHSPLRRAAQTAQVICQKLAKPGQSFPAPVVNPNLIEVSLPLWEGLLFEEVKLQFPEAYQNWHKAPHELEMTVASPNGPEIFRPIPALFDQAAALWQQLLPQHSNQTLLLVGHSGINRSLICTALGLPPERYQTLQQANCNISVLNFPDGTLASAQLEALNLTSHLGLPLPKPRKGYEALRILLVRHGETDWNRQGRFQGQIDIPLNATGQQQGQQAADFLQPIGIDFAITSPMKRPKETAAAILTRHSRLALEEEAAFCEISHGTWEGKLESEIEAAYPGELERWRTQPETVQMPAGENLQQVWERAIAAWQDMVTQRQLSGGKTQPVGLVVAHDATNKVILCHVVGAGPEKFWCFKQGNGAVSVIDYATDGRAILQAMNITTHLAGGVLDQTAAGAL